jgi:hypothetical protein
LLVKASFPCLSLASRTTMCRQPARSRRLSARASSARRSNPSQDDHDWIQWICLIRHHGLPIDYSHGQPVGQVSRKSLRGSMYINTSYLLSDIFTLFPFRSTHGLSNACLTFHFLQEIDDPAKSMATQFCRKTERTRYLRCSANHIVCCSLSLASSSIASTIGAVEPVR